MLSCLNFPCFKWLIFDALNVATALFCQSLDPHACLPVSMTMHCIVPVFVRVQIVYLPYTYDKRGLHHFPGEPWIVSQSCNNGCNNGSKDKNILFESRVIHDNAV